MPERETMGARGRAGTADEALAFAGSLDADAVMAAVREGYHAETGIQPEIYRFGAVDGARVLSC